MTNFSDIVRSFPFPVLEEGNISFPRGEYAPEVEIDEDGCMAQIHHKIRTASLIERFVNNKKAACCCTVSIPKTGYRELFRGNEFSQKITWNRDWVGEPPILRPLIVCTEEIEHELQIEDGVHDMWIGKVVRLQKGVKIAIGPDVRPTSSIQSLLNIEKDDSIENGRMYVNPTTDNGFYFNVKVAPDLYKFLLNPGGVNCNKHRNSILTHAVSSCFSILAEEYNDADGEDGWRSYSNLRALAGDMQDRQIPIWYEDDFKPEKAATILHPHVVPEPEE